MYTVQQTEQLYRQRKVVSIDDDVGGGCQCFYKDISSLVLTRRKDDCCDITYFGHLPELFIYVLPFETALSVIYCTVY